MRASGARCTHDHEYPSQFSDIICKILSFAAPQGLRWLVSLQRTGLNGILADEMGLGKTLQVLTVLATRRVPGKSTLIVCPASVVPVWREEIAKFFPDLPVDVLKTGHDFTQQIGRAHV